MFHWEKVWVFKPSQSNFQSGLYFGVTISVLHLYFESNITNYFITLPVIQGLFPSSGMWFRSVEAGEVTYQSLD